MELEELGDQALAVLCVFARGRHGVSARGWVTIDPGSIAHRLPQRLRAGVKGTCEYLYKQGFLARKPKSDDIVYSLKTNLPADLATIVAKIQADPTIFDKVRKGLPLSSPPPPPFEGISVHPGLVERIEGTLSKSPRLQIITVDEEAEVELEDEESGTAYHRVSVWLKVRCTGCSEHFEHRIILGYLDQFESSSARCPSCGRGHTFRGVSLQSG